MGNVVNLRSTSPVIEIALGPQAKRPTVDPDCLLGGRIIEQMTQNWSPFERRAIAAAIAEGIAQGRTTADIVRRIRVKPRNLAAAVHSAAMSESARLRERMGDANGGAA